MTESLLEQCGGDIPQGASRIEQELEGLGTGSLLLSARSESVRNGYGRCSTWKAQLLTRPQATTETCPELLSGARWYLMVFLINRTLYMSTEPLSLTFAALADPTRRSI